MRAFIYCLVALLLVVVGPSWAGLNLPPGQADMKQFPVSAYGVKADTQYVTVSMTASSNQCTLSSGTWPASAVGKGILVQGAGVTFNARGA